MCSFYNLLIFFSNNHISNDYYHTAHIFNFILYCLHKSQHHLCVVFIIYSFLFSKNHISNDYFHTAHIFNFISAIYYWIYLKLWWIALNDLVDDTCSYRRAANSYPPAYPGCHGLRLMSIGLRLGGPQSHYVLYSSLQCLV